ncbi:7234_t:CDS:2 [Ambispora leptoticha]|uniref:7234_t:CDS:1 n=1 Tax=Ambispora leptoticha TaxID=144679 RepID=A0A9N8WEN7_9GLOM|nr:7234_t:CDS:2 [Ambispora leptoticha]
MASPRMTTTTTDDIITNNAASIAQELPSQQPDQPINATEIGWLFVQEYYTFMHKEPSRLHCFYNVRSIYTTGKEGETVKTCHGPQEINNKIMELGLNDTTVLVTNVDSQASLNGGIVIQVLGQMANKGEESRKFAQTFFLAVQPNGFFILNDILRFLADEVEDETREPPVEDTPLPVEEETSEENNNVVLPEEKPLGEESNSPTGTLVDEPINENTHVHHNIQLQDNVAVDSQQQSDHPAAEEPAPDTVSVSPPKPAEQIPEPQPYVLSSPRTQAIDRAVSPKNQGTSATPQPAVTSPKNIIASQQNTSVQAATDQTQIQASANKSPKAVQMSPPTKNNNVNGNPKQVPQNTNTPSTTTAVSNVPQAAPVQPAAAQANNAGHHYNNETSSNQQQHSSEQLQKRAGSSQQSSTVNEISAPTKKTWAHLAANDRDKWNNQLAPVSAHVSSAPVQTSKPQQQSMGQSGRDQMNRRQEGQRGDPQLSIYIKNVNDTMSYEQLRIAFTQFGPLKNLDVVHQKSCAFAEYTTVEACHRALQARQVTVGNSYVITEARRKPTGQRNLSDNRNQGGYQRNSYQNQNGMNNRQGGRQDRRNSATHVKQSP